jgi:hypothetical protein
MPSKKTRANYLGGALTAICELMCSYGIPKKSAENQFRLAVKRGYARVIVRPSREFRPITGMADVCSRWHIEDAYVDRTGKPKPLTWNGRTGGLLKLAQRVNGKANARAVVLDLIARKLVRRTQTGAWVPKAQIVSPSGLDSAQVLRTATMMDYLLRTIAYNSARRYRGATLLEVMARVPSLPTREIADFKRFAKSQGLVFAKTMDDWLETRNALSPTKRSVRTREAGIVAFAFERPSTEV